MSFGEFEIEAETRRCVGSFLASHLGKQYIEDPFLVTSSGHLTAFCEEN